MLVALGATDCERVGAGFLAQPANAVSSLAFVAVGGWLLWRSAAPGAPRVSFVTGGTALAGVGLASAGYHGPQPAWAEPVHEGSIVALGVVMAGHGIWWLSRRFGSREAGGGRWWAAAGACGAAGLAAYVAGRTGGPLCRPESLLQPHAAWHVLVAAALGAAVVACGEVPRAPAVMAGRGIARRPDSLPQ